MFNYMKEWSMSVYLNNFDMKMLQWLMTYDFFCNILVITLSLHTVNHFISAAPNFRSLAAPIFAF